MSSPRARTHKEYQEFVKKELAFRRIEIPLIFQDVFIKLYQLDLSPVSLILEERYSHRGTPTRNPQDMLRSLLAMTLLGVTSIDEWIAFLRSFPSLAILSGFLPHDASGVGTFYDFFDRLYLMEKSASKAKGKTRLKRKPRKNKKIKDEMSVETSPEHNHTCLRATHRQKGVIQRLIDRMIKEDIRQRTTGSFHIKPDYLLQRIFKECFVLPSARLRIIDLENLSLAGDGTKLSTFASHYGKKICSCKDSCNHPRFFSDRGARWGWDSFHEVWVYGYGIHELVDLGSGLPIILPKLTGANIHDGIAVVALMQEVLEQGYRIRHSVFDSAYDNYHFYRLLIDYCRISPIICLNKRCQGISYNKDLIFFTRKEFLCVFMDFL